MFSHSNTQHQLNSDYQTTLDHNDDEESFPLGQNSSLSHFISSSDRLNEDEEDEPLLLRQRNCQKQINTNKNENDSNSSEESEQQQQQHQERLSDTTDEEEDATEEDDADDSDDDVEEEDDDEDDEDDDEDDDDDDDDDFDDKKRSRTKSKRGFGQAKAKSKKQVKRAKTIPNNSSTTSNRKRQRTSSSTNYASASKKARRQQSSGSGNSSISANKRKIRRTAASNPINYHEESDDDINDQARRKMKKQQRHLSSNSDSDDEQNANTNNDDESNSNDYHSQTITDLELNTAKRQTKVRTSDNLSSSGEGVTIVTDEPSSEIIEKVLKVRFGRKDATGPSTTIYNIDEFGDPNANYNGDDETQSDGEEQFLIKWKNWSHLHNTWESRSSLQQAHVKSSRILENFLKQHEQTRLWRRENLNMDEIELFECQQELNDTALAGYQIVERIVAHEKNREQENTYDYLCKWDGLQYSDCTWEDGNLIAKRFQIRIDEYNARLTQQAEDLQLQQQQQQQQQQTSSGRKKMVITRPRFVPITVQPLYLAPEEPEFKLRDYQLEGLNWLAHSWCKQNSVILADEMGLGKTIQTISFLSYVFEEHCVHGPFLIVVPLSTVQGWQQEFRRWAPHMNTVIYIGDMISREKIRHFEMYASGNKKQLKFHALLTTYDFLLKDSKYLSSINWSVVLVDEAHRLKNDDSMLYRTLIQFESQHRILITGTPLQNSLKELWSLLHFIMPNYFDDWNHFDSKYSSLLTSHDTSLVKRSSELHKELEPFLLRRVKRDVEKSLPAKVEQILRVEMTRIQKQYYKWILTRNYRALTNERGGNLPSFINIMMELKKCANHAFFVKRDDENNTTLDEIIKGSGKLLLLDKLLLKLRASNHRVLIFSQMVKMLNILAEYCKLRRFPFQRLDGSMKGEIRRQALNSFNREASEDFIFLLSTRAGGLGINLATADTVIIYDSDWNPQNDLQAQARAHRIGQTKQVNIYRLVAKQSVEETIIERAKQKMVLDHLVIQRMDTTGRNAFQNLNNTSTSASSSTTDNRPLTKEELNTIIKFGAEDLFKENSTNEEGSVEEESQKIDIDEILRRAETRQDDDSSLRNNSEDLLSQFKIANIQTMEDDIIEPTTIVNKSKSWKDIIPESERQKFDDECLAELTAALPPRSRKRVELFNSTSETDNNNNTNRRSLNEFTANEIRRFVKSFKKFSDPIHRLDLVTIDAELEDKSRQDIEELAKHLYNECLLAVEQHTNELSPTTNSQSPKDEQQTNSREKIPTIRLQSVSINALQLINSIRDLEALKKLFTSTNEQRKTFSFPSSIKIKPVHWSCSWSFEDDKALLRGIYEYGYSNWEQIKMEPELGLSSKILLDDKQLKPQANHLQTRADYLLRLLKQYYANPSNKKKDVAKKKKTPVAPITTKKTKITAEENLNGSNSFKKQRRTNGPTVNNHEKQPKSKEIIENSSADEEASTNKSIKKKSIDHRTHTHTEDKINKPLKKDEENASNDMFKQCKELLRPVKKWFSKLDAPEEAFDSHDDYTKEFEKCLLKIGDQIEYVLKTKKDDDYHTYRYHLWTFVSKFTTKLTDSQLKKYYRTFTKKRDEDTNLISNHSSQKSSSSSHSQQSQQQQQHHQYSQSNTKNRQTEQDETYRKAGWGSSTQSSSNTNINNRNIKDSRLKHTSTMPITKSSSRSEQLNSTIGSTNTGTTSDYDRNRHRRSYHDSTGDSSSDYRSNYHRDRDRDSNSSRGPRRFDSMPSRYDQSSYNNRSSFQSNFSQPPPPYDETRSSNRSSGNNKNPNRSTQNSTAPPPPPPVAPPLPPPPPPPPLSGPEIFQSMYLQYYDMYMQQATGLSSSQSSTTTNSISPNSYPDRAAVSARDHAQSSKQ